MEREGIGQAGRVCSDVHKRTAPCEGRSVPAGSAVGSQGCLSAVATGSPVPRKDFVRISVHVSGAGTPDASAPWTAGRERRVLAVPATRDGRVRAACATAFPRVRRRALRALALEDRHSPDMRFRCRVVEITKSWADPVSQITGPGHKMPPARACELPHIGAIFVEAGDELGGQPAVSVDGPTGPTGPGGAPGSTGRSGER